MHKAILFSARSMSSRQNDRPLPSWFVPAQYPVMRLMGTFAGILLILLTLIDGFETILQPRRVTHRFRYARLFYRSTWRIWRFLALRFSVGKRRETVLSIFGPLSLLGLFASWILWLIFGFTLIFWSRQ